MQYRPEIDGLRAVAVLPVLFFHAGFNGFAGGYVGVDVFFVISGYLICSIILKQLNQDRFSIVDFYDRRARRILPALFLVMLCCVPAAWILMTPGELIDFGESVLASTLFYANYHFWSEAGYFAGPAELKPLLHTWSLSVEEQYYLLFPILLALLWKAPRWILLTVLVLGGLLSFVAAEWGSVRYAAVSFYWLPTRGWELLVGVGAAFYLHQKQPGYLAVSMRLANVLGLCGLGLIAYASIAFDAQTLWPGRWALFPTVGTLLIILFAVPGTFVGKALSLRAVVGVGLISYSLYLWHQPLLAFARLAHEEELSFGLSVGLLLLATALAWFSWRFVEGYFRDPKRLPRSTIFALSAAGMIAFASFGLATKFNQGFGSRFEHMTPQLMQTRDQFSDYVGPRFEARQGTPFDEDQTTRNILVIGDSFGKDIVNALFESSLANSISVSTHHIEGDCGNLFLLDYAAIESFEHSRCRAGKSNFLPDGRYDSPTLRQRLGEADEIWLVSSWFPWVVDFLPQSISNIQKFSDASIRVFSRKAFGPIDFKEIIEATPAQRQAMRFKLPEKFLTVHQQLSAAAQGAEFVDMTTWYCEKQQVCRLFDADGALLSYDGGHLTREGAVLFGRELEKLH